MGEVPSPALTPVLEERLLQIERAMHKSRRHNSVILKQSWRLTHHSDKNRTTMDNLPPAPKEVGHGFVPAATLSPEIPPSSLDIHPKDLLSRPSEDVHWSDCHPQTVPRGPLRHQGDPVRGRSKERRLGIIDLPPWNRNPTLKILDDLTAIPFVPVISRVESPPHLILSCLNLRYRMAPLTLFTT